MLLSSGGLKKRIIPVENEGMEIQLGDTVLKLIPSHFLHSPGNFSLYDPVSKILFSGDVGASLIPPEQDYDFVENFEEHVKYIEEFHKRYMASSKACKAWVERVRGLDVEAIVPQHGAIMKGREIVDAFLEWLYNLECGVDLL